MSYLKKKTSTNPLGRNAFDLSQKRLFTASVGELLPIYCAETLPGDKFEIQVDDFLRTQTCNTACFSRLKQYVHFFFVPTRVLSTKFANYITRSPRMESTAFLPFTGDGNDPTFLDYKSQSTFPILSTLIQLASVKDTVSKKTWDELFNNNWPSSIWSNESASDAFLAARALKLLDLLEYGVGNIDYSTLGAVTQDAYKFHRQNSNGTLSGKAWLEFENPNGVSTNNVVRARANLFRLLAYNRIYQDYYRDVRLESYNSIYSNIDDRMGITENPDSIANNAFFEKNLSQSKPSLPRFYIRYRNYPLDYVTSADLNPFKQDSLLNTLPFANDSSSSAFKLGASVKTDIGTSPLQNGLYSGINQSVNLFTRPAWIGYDDSAAGVAYAGYSSPFQLRAAYALERWASRQAHAKSQSYADLVRAHFGVEPSQLDTLFLGGTSAPVVINENVSTAATAEANLGQLSGVGKSTLDGKKITFSTKEHGIIIGIFSLAPEPDYNSWMVDRHNLHTLPEDYFTPEFDGLGYQAVTETEILNNPMRYLASPLSTSPLNTLSPFGYHPIYSEYRGKIDKVFGQFTSYQSLNYWVNARNPYGTNNTINNSFMKVQPQDVDAIFQINYLSKIDNIELDWDYNFTDQYPKPLSENEYPSKGVSINDQFFVNFETDVKAIRHMSSDGVIY